MTVKYSSLVLEEAPDERFPPFVARSPYVDVMPRDRWDRISKTVVFQSFAKFFLAGTELTVNFSGRIVQRDEETDRGRIGLGDSGAKNKYLFI